MQLVFFFIIYLPKAFIVVIFSDLFEWNHLITIEYNPGKKMKIQIEKWSHKLIADDVICESALR